MATAACVAEDGLIINGKGDPWSCEGLMPQYRGMPGQGGRGGWGSTLTEAGGGGDGIRGFWRWERPRKEIMFKM